MFLEICKALMTYCSWLITGGKNKLYKNKTCVKEIDLYLYKVSYVMSLKEEEEEDMASI